MRGTTHVNDFVQCRQFRDQLHDVEISMGSRTSSIPWGHLKIHYRNREVGRPQEYWAGVAQIYFDHLQTLNRRGVDGRKSDLLKRFPTIIDIRHTPTLPPTPASLTRSLTSSTSTLIDSIPNTPSASSSKRNAKTSSIHSSQRRPEVIDLTDSPSSSRCAKRIRSPSPDNHVSRSKGKRRRVDREEVSNEDLVKSCRQLCDWMNSKEDGSDVLTREIVNLKYYIMSDW
ncbi:hypothetical protein AAF712_011986 [Marasmius tenuissimus]|uniref:Uncharacterized protein n=1 Tax=Marasmius tenuissimus TaxID=585030 RepID=A0ABR2ZL98_9AGAR